MYYSIFTVLRADSVLRDVAQEKKEIEILAQEKRNLLLVTL